MNSYAVCFLFVLFDLTKERLCEPNVSLRADSWEVEFRADVTLYCDYNLENYSLNSVKWYRGIKEFFRYDPIVAPQLKTFPIGSTKIDLNRSNATQVTLQKVGYEFDGQVRCQITIGIEDFYREKEAQGNLSVVCLPRENPVIVTNKDKYLVNDTLLANCTSSLSHPALSLSFLLNNEPVGTPSSKHLACSQNEEGFPTFSCENNDNTTYWTWLPLNITLTSRHFDRGVLHLQCTAVADFYRRSTYIHIPPERSEPKSQKVTSLDSSSRNAGVINYHLMMLAVFWMLS